MPHGGIFLLVSRKRFLYARHHKFLIDSSPHGGEIMIRTNSFTKKAWTTPQISGISAMSHAQASKAVVSAVETTLVGNPYNVNAGPSS